LDRRNYVRSLFALFEATLVNLRETVAQLLVDKATSTGRWDQHALIPLLDETVTLGDGGKLRTEASKLPFLNLVAYTLKKYSETVGLDAAKHFSDNGWNCFQQALKNVRHRITHPKRDDSVDISDSDIKTLKAAHRWWKRILRDLHLAHARHSAGPHRR
jgi:hypothetical protein